MSRISRWRAWLLRRRPAAVWLAVAVSLLGLALRIEHAATFDGPRRGADYSGHMEGIRWMQQHWRAFDVADKGLSAHVSSQAPLWYMLGALIVRGTHSERALATLAVLGWVLRQLLLARILAQAIPGKPWSACAALAINAVLPLAILIDGKVNPEGLHASLFMLAVYGLWRMEQEIAGSREIRRRTAALFGVAAGLALMTKATSATLIIAAAIAAARWAFRDARLVDLASARRRILRPMLFAAAAWVAVTGWWCGPNLWRHHHPFPHAYSQLDPKAVPLLAPPVLYRRPLGWALPFDWQPALSFPILRSATDPRQNFWAVSVVGTWSDWYNRGFCRLGGRRVGHVWGTEDRRWGGPFWDVTDHCVSLFRGLVWLGLPLTLLTVIATGWVGRRGLRTDGKQGSLTLPLVAALGVLFVMLFALVYPFDMWAILNPRYLLPVTTPLSACLGIFLGQYDGHRKLRAALHAIAFAAIAAVTALVIVERWP